MTNEQTATIVLKDETGSYFLVSREALEWGRVPAAHTAKVERLIAGASGEDVQGHSYRILLSPTLVKLLDDLPKYVAPSAPIDWEAAFEGGTTYYGD
jgi:hypothetical protein